MRTTRWIPGIVLLTCFFFGCGSSKHTVTDQAMDESSVRIREAASLISHAFEEGDCSKTRLAMQTVFNELDQAGEHGDLSSKIGYLDRSFPLSNGSSYRHIFDACQVTRSPMIAETESAPEPEEVLEEASAIADEADFGKDIHALIRREIGLILFELEGRSPREIPDDFVRDIERYIHLYQNERKYRTFFERSLRRSRKYVPALRPYFAAKGLPEELIIGIATVESGFNPTALSHAGARGLFQFMPATGRQYKLRVNRSVDERNAPIQSAIACSEYLMDLLMEFGDLGLALSAYNGGPGRIRQALRELDDFRNRNFWALRERTDILRPETQAYVSQIYAAMVMGKPGNGRYFGFDEVPYPDSTSYRMLLIPQRTRITQLASAAGTTVDDLLVLNPDLEADMIFTPSGAIDYPLFVPVGRERSLRAALRNESSTPVRLASTDRHTPTESSGSVYIRYVAQRGNTLSEIATWFGVSSRQIRNWNPYLRNRGLWAGDVVHIRDLNPNWKKVNHVIRRGETLSSIARKYDVSVAAIRSWNGLRNDRITSGSRLVIYSNTGSGRRS